MLYSTKRAPQSQRPLEVYACSFDLEQKDQQKDDQDQSKHTSTDIHTLLLSVINHGAITVAETPELREVTLPFGLPITQITCQPWAARD
jgi:hypothetical protein